MRPDPMRYALQLEMLEQKGVAGEEQAIDLVRSEFALAQNAGCFDAVTTDDIELGEIVRSTPQEGVTRYAVEMLVEERSYGLDDHRALAVLCQAFTKAINASYFMRICDDALTMRLVARAPVAAPLAALRAPRRQLRGGLAPLVTLHAVIVYHGT